MSNRRKPAHLILKKQKSGATYFFIRDYDERGTRREFGTGKNVSEREAAEDALAAHIAATHRPNDDSGRDPAAITIAEVLEHYWLCKGDPVDERKRVTRPRALASRLEQLRKFFGLRSVAALNETLCQNYVTSRMPHLQAARRDLEDLRAALAYVRKKRIIDIAPFIELPAKADRRERWLTRSEAARLLWAAWRYREPSGRRSRQHVARFILVALYTGTRSAAICEAALGPAIGRGYVDLDQGVFYRRAPGSAETNKRRPPARLPDRLLAHIRRWQRRGISLKSVVEFNSRPVRSVKRAFAAAVANAQLAAPKVTPHTLRHTAITWSLQGGATVWEASEFFGVGHGIIDRVYGHHSPARHKTVGLALTRGSRKL